MRRKLLVLLILSALSCAPAADGTDSRETAAYSIGKGYVREFLTADGYLCEIGRAHV